MKVALAQINPTVADIDGNTDRILKYVDSAKRQEAAVVVFPELAVFGYPPKDLVLRRELVKKNVAAVSRIATHCEGITAVVGYVKPDDHGEGKGIFNAAAICSGGRVVHEYAKALLPTYDVFDESRYFDKRRTPLVLPVSDGANRWRAGITICEDLWNDQQFEGRRVYGYDPIDATVAAGANFIINLSASPFQVGKQNDREVIFGAQMREYRTPLVYVNQVGGNDDLIFDGGSLVMDDKGKVVARAKTFEQDLLVVDISSPRGLCPEYPGRLESLRRALVCGLRDYVRKCGFKSVVVGLSGGIDSALTAALATEALGAENVHGVALPSRFSSDHSLVDARELASNLGIGFQVIPIDGLHKNFEELLTPIFAGRKADVTEENLQARIRGVILMALSNKFGWLLLTTGNKSELAVGYCTLYGDMCGGLAVLSDVPKTVVFELSRHVNEQMRRPWIPQRSIDKPPSAELRPNQTDQDSLPPYDVLDAILHEFVECDKAVDDIAAAGFDPETVRRVVRMVQGSEYKRNQAPVGLRVTSRAFGTGRRVPIAAQKF